MGQRVDKQQHENVICLLLEARTSAQRVEVVMTNAFGSKRGLADIMPR